MQACRIGDGVLKKSSGVLRERVQVRYAYIAENRGSSKLSIRAMCRLLELDKSGYYKWRRRCLSLTRQRREVLEVQIKEIFEEEHRIPGHRKIHRILCRRGFECSLGLTRKLCRNLGISSCAFKKRRFKPKTTDSAHSNHVNRNILNRDFATTGPNQKWLADITYITMKNGQSLYLSAIIDLHSRKILSWIVAPHMRAELVVDTLKKAIRNRRNTVPKNILFHSDRGVQYTSDELRQTLKRFGITQSMSGKGDCGDNAPCESFWGKLKQEWLAQYGPFENIEQVRLALFEYIDGYYYAKRLHQALGYRTPRDVEEEFLRNH